MLLHEATWPEVEAYLTRSTGVIIPTGSTEQHGPNGLIGTDSICPEAIAGAAGESADALVGPTLALGVAPFNLGFPGTVTARPSTFIALVEDYVASLARHGFDRFYFLNGHGGNIAPLKSAFQEIYTRLSLAPADGSAAPRFRLRSWWDYPEVDALRRELYGQWEGMHATPSEVAITQHLRPHTVKPTQMTPPQAVSAAFLKEHAGDAHGQADDHRRRFPDGRIGSDPSLATPEAGRQLLAAAAQAAGADYRAFLDEP
jgi:creatinine amidohydrolase